MKQMTVEEFVIYLSEQPSNQVICFSLSEDEDDASSFGACFHDLYEGQVLTFGYWGSESSEDFVLFATTPYELKESSDKQEQVADGLKRLLRDWGYGYKPYPQYLYLKEGTCTFQSAYYTQGECNICTGYDTIEYTMKSKTAPSNGGDASFCPKCGRCLAGD